MHNRLPINSILRSPPRELLTLLVCLTLSSTLFSQNQELPTVSVKVLAWNKTIDNTFILSAQGPMNLTARRGQISSAHRVPISSGVQILRKVGGDTPDQAGFQTLLQIPIPSNVTKEGLLILAEVDGELKGNLVPFAEDQIAYDSLTVFNFTKFPVAAEIDDHYLSIPPKNHLSIPYHYKANEKEALKSRLAIQTEEGWDLVKNGFIPIIPQGRILFFISEDMPSPAARRIRPVRFTYVFEIQASEEIRRQLDELDLVDPNETYKPAPF